jgi:hypothetical protein
MAGASKELTGVRPAGAVVHGNSPRRYKEGEWVTAILTIGDKQRHSSGDEPTTMKGEQRR